MGPRRAAEHSAARACVGIALALAIGCASTPEGDLRYRPAESLLEVVAVLRRHVPDDTYRFEPARDYTGRNVYRSALLRLESFEKLHPDALNAGHMDGVIAFAKGRALERLRAFDLAAEEYRLASEHDEQLASEAMRSESICRGLHAAASIAAAPAETLRPGAEVRLRDAHLDAVRAAFEERQALLANLERDARGSHYEAVVREEIERADGTLASYYVARRAILPDGDLRAVAELQGLVLRHRDSKNANRHLLALADLYGELAEEYVAARPPESLDFDPVEFQELIDTAARLYEMVANQDGTPEKLEAARRLEAFLAFALRIDRDRFTP